MIVARGHFVKRSGEFSSQKRDCANCTEKAAKSPASRRPAAWPGLCNTRLQEETESGEIRHQTTAFSRGGADGIRFNGSDFIKISFFKRTSQKEASGGRFRTRWTCKGGGRTRRGDPGSTGRLRAAVPVRLLRIPRKTRALPGDSVKAPAAARSVRQIPPSVSKAQTRSGRAGFRGSSGCAVRSAPVLSGPAEQSGRRPHG